MARTFKNVSTGVKVETSNERVAAMYADHPSWKEVKKRSRGGAAANGSAAADSDESANSNSADTSAASTGLAKDSDNEED